MATDTQTAGLTGLPTSTSALRRGVNTVFGGFLMLLGVGLALGILATFGGLAAFSVVKGVDVLWAGVQAVHPGSDLAASPADAELCKGLFCRRADTTLKHVCGSDGRQSETFISFCPDHQRSDYWVFLDLSHLGTMTWYAYCGCVLFCAVAWSSAAIGGCLTLVGSPALLFLDAERRGTFFSACGTLGVVGGLIVGGAASAAYVWW